MLADLVASPAWTQVVLPRIRARKAQLAETLIKHPSENAALEHATASAKWHMLDEIERDVAAWLKMRR